jgi:hypothetical protein
MNKEPIGWMYQREDGVGVLNFERNFELIDKGYKEIPLYTHPAQPLTRDWIGTALERADKDEAFRKGLIGELAQPLSDDEIERLADAITIKWHIYDFDMVKFARAIEAHHGIK